LHYHSFNPLNFFFDISFLKDNYFNNLKELFKDEDYSNLFGCSYSVEDDVYYVYELDFFMNDFYFASKCYHFFFRKD